MLVVAAWNVSCTGRLVRCLDHLPPPRPPRAQAAAGERGGGTAATNTNATTDDEPQQEGDRRQHHDDNDRCEEEAAAAEDEGNEAKETCFPDKDDIDDDRDRCTSPNPPPGTSTLGRVGYAAFGIRGLQTLDLLMVLLLLGIVISYVCAAVSFLRDAAAPFRSNTINLLVASDETEATWLASSPSPSSSPPSWAPAAAVAFAMWTMSLVPNVGYLSKMSAVGLLVLLLTFAVIAVYGAVGSDGPAFAAIPLFPSSVEGMCRWYGIVVYSMGTVPLTYNFRESLKHRHQIMDATRLALGSVAVSYLVLGFGTLVIFPDLEGDILHELPGITSAVHPSSANSSSYQAVSSPVALWRPCELVIIIPLLARIAMVSVVIMTAPLLIVPCGELVEGKLFHRRQQLGGGPSHHHQQQSNSNHHHNHLMCIGVTRGIICLVSAAAAIAFPSFVQVLAIVGSACVGTVSFVVPPLFHYRLRALQQRQKCHSDDEDNNEGGKVEAAATIVRRRNRIARIDREAAFDLAMLAAGAVSTVLATLFSIRGEGG
jgi:amino acid permease